MPTGPAPLPPDDSGPRQDCERSLRQYADELRERDERLLDADAERWIAEWGGDD